MSSRSKEQISRNMRKIKNKDSRIEVLLRKALWHRGMRYQKNVRGIYGCPDIVFKGKKIVIFCDSEFWHGYDWDNRKKDFKSNRDFWVAKIERNMARDTEVTRKLAADGWTVLRFWGKEIKNNLTGCVEKILAAVNDNGAIQEH